MQKWYDWSNHTKLSLLFGVFPKGFFPPWLTLFNDRDPGLAAADVFFDPLPDPPVTPFRENEGPLLSAS